MERTRKRLGKLSKRIIIIIVFDSEYYSIIAEHLKSKVSTSSNNNALFSRIIVLRPPTRVIYCIGNFICYF